MSSFPVRKAKKEGEMIKYFSSNRIVQIRETVILSTNKHAMLLTTVALKGFFGWFYAITNQQYITNIQ